MAKFRCIRKCYCFLRLWLPGEILSTRRVDEVPKHFVKVNDADLAPPPPPPPDPVKQVIDVDSAVPQEGASEGVVDDLELVPPVKKVKGKKAEADK